jgi:hypothetical protein
VVVVVVVVVVMPRSYTLDDVDQSVGAVFACTGNAGRRGAGPDVASAGSFLALGALGLGPEAALAGSFDLAADALGGATAPRLRGAGADTAFTGLGFGLAVAGTFIGLGGPLGAFDVHGGAPFPCGRAAGRDGEITGAMVGPE